MMDDTPPRVLVVLLNYRTPEMTLRAAAAALPDIRALDAELVIVDNASGDGSPALIQRKIADEGWEAGGLVRFIESPVNGGFGAGNNIGLRSKMSDGAEPDFFYLLNSDAFPDPGCLPRLLRHLLITPKAGMAGSHVRGEDDVAHVTAFRFPSILGELEQAARFGPISRLFKRAIIAPPLPETDARVDWVAGASVLLRGSMMRDIGLFDETFFLYYEETDLCRRAANRGWECWYLPEARVVHIGSVSTGMKTWARIPGYWFDSRRHYFTKNHGRAYALGALAARLTGGAMHVLRSRLSGKAPQDPAYFYRDLIRHALHLPPAADAKAPHRPATEDQP